MGNVEKAGATLAPKKSEALEGDGILSRKGRMPVGSTRWLVLGRGGCVGTIWGGEALKTLPQRGPPGSPIYKSIHFRRLPTVSDPACGRGLHQPLKVSSRYSDWLSGPCPRHVTGRARQSAGRHISSRGRDVGQQRMAHDVVTRSPRAISAGAAARYLGGRARRDPWGWHLEE